VTDKALGHELVNDSDRWFVIFPADLNELLPQITLGAYMISANMTR